MISTNGRASTEFDESGAIAAYFHSQRAPEFLPPLDHLATPAGRVQVEKAIARKLADLVVAHGAATKEALRCLFTCREIRECLPGAVRRLPSAVRDIALAA